MKLRGIEFGNVLGASGLQGFFGEGYWFHRLPWPLGPRFKGLTFVAKTTTLHPHKGNMPLTKQFTPREFKPRCIWVNLFQGITLNAVGLSGPGFEALLETGKWQRRTEPFFISLMAIGTTKKERLKELGEFVNTLKPHLQTFKAPLGIQINFSCPNVGLDSQELINEIHDALNIMTLLNVVLVPKFSVSMPVEAALEISKHPACDALCISNTIPFGALPEKINWSAYFPSGTSPLQEFRGGGLGGKPLLKLVVEWVYTARKAGITIPVIAGGGILSFRNATLLHWAGASSVFIGSIAMLRPWRVQGIISRAHELFSAQRES